MLTLRQQWPQKYCRLQLWLYPEIFVLLMALAPKLKNEIAAVSDWFHACLTAHRMHLGHSGQQVFNLWIGKVISHEFSMGLSFETDHFFKHHGYMSYGFLIILMGLVMRHNMVNGRDRILICSCIVLQKSVVLDIRLKSKIRRPWGHQTFSLCYKSVCCVEWPLEVWPEYLKKGPLFDKSNKTTDKSGHLVIVEISIYYGYFLHLSVKSWK